MDEGSGGGRWYLQQVDRCRWLVGTRCRLAPVAPCHAWTADAPDRYRPSPSTAMFAKLIVLFACLALSQCGMVRRDAPATPSPLDELQKHAAEFQKTISEQWTSLTSSQNTQEFNKVLKDGSDSVLQQLSALSSSLQGALSDANGKAKEALEATRANIERTAEELRKSHPEVEQQANQFKDKLQAAVQSTVAETQKLAKEISENAEQAGKKLAPQLQSAYQDFVKQAQDVQKKLHEAATKQ